MEKRRTSSYIFFGTAVRYLLDAREGQPLHEDDVGLTYNLRRVLELMPELGLSVTQRLAAGQHLPRLLAEMNAAGNGATLSTDQYKLLHEAMREVRNTALAEARGLFAFTVVEKRFSVESLLDDVASLFPEGNFRRFSTIAQSDLDEAGKCIAFERPTAAAFHLMRAVEAILRDFYCATVKRGRIDPLLWGPMVQHLRGRSAPPPAALLDQLDSVRRNFRNPTQHPEATYDIHEAQDLLSVSVDVINRMVRAWPT